MSAPKPVVLCILDGWGLRNASEANAPVLADTPNFDDIMAKGPTAKLIAHGPDVGLPEGQMGNSEVGHSNLGAGRVVMMTLGRVDTAVDEGTLAEQPAFAEFIDKMKASNGTAHLMGVVSDGGVHGMADHLEAAVQAVIAAGVPVVVHAIIDGRDVPPKSAGPFIDHLQAAMPQNAWIGTVIGRYFAMDRDNRWERVSQAYAAMIAGKGVQTAETAKDALLNAYSRDETDEFVLPTVIGDYEGAKPNDGFFCLNFRADRAREIIAAIAAPDFDAFDIAGRPSFAAVMGMVSYSSAHDAYSSVVFPKDAIRNTIGAWVAKQGLRQFRLAETEKYPHVTYFFNGGKETPEVGEDRCMPKSPKVATYDLQPEMSSGEVTDSFVAAIEEGYDLIVCNYANPDMVGHTGNLQTAMAACAAVDVGLGRVMKALEQADGAMIITADHGNCETMVDPKTGKPHTAHTTNPVPVALIGGPEGAQLHDGRLTDVAPTLLELMGLDQPVEMTGKSLLS